MKHFFAARGIRLPAGFLLLWVSVSLGCAGLPQPGIPAAAPETAPANREATPTPFQPLLAQPATPASVATTAAGPPTSTVAAEPVGTAATEIPSPAEPPASRAGVSLWVEPELPAGVRAALSLPQGWALAESAAQGQVSLGAGSGAAGERPVTRWVYTLAAPFPTIPGAVSSEDLLRCWRGDPAGPFGEQPLLLDVSTLALFSRLWGEPAAGSVRVVPAEDLLRVAWDSRPSWALAPFEALGAQWKVLEVDGSSPLRNTFDAGAWPLSVPFVLMPSANLSLPEDLTLLPASNRDPAKLTVVALTGVTALVRATAFTMEQKGVLYPAGDIAGLLRSADLTHISNEVPFSGDCPYPDPVQQDLRFCSDPRYIELLEAVGADIIELTGDHFQDWGQAAMLETLQIYNEHEMPYYGGGANLEEGRKALLVEHNGNRLAFIGCNAKGGSFAQAGADRPGAAACDMEWMAGEVSRLRREGYLPIATFQHYEYYTYAAQANQKQDARQLAEAGAVVISGSQAHQPQAFEFDEQALIHHGLGNLFFDQYDVSEATRQGFVDFHVFYDNRYLGVELLPIQFIDYARPRPMTAEEMEAVLQALFAASGW